MPESFWKIEGLRDGEASEHSGTWVAQRVIPGFHSKWGFRTGSKAKVTEPQKTFQYSTVAGKRYDYENLHALFFP
jgi:hypothetical protein